MYFRKLIYVCLIAIQVSNATPFSDSSALDKILNHDLSSFMHKYRKNLNEEKIEEILNRLNEELNLQNLYPSRINQLRRTSNSTPDSSTKKPKTDDEIAKILLNKLLGVVPAHVKIKRKYFPSSYDSESDIMMHQYKKTSPKIIENTLKPKQVFFEKIKSFLNFWKQNAKHNIFMDEENIPQDKATTTEKPRKNETQQCNNSIKFETVDHLKDKQEESQTENDSKKDNMAESMKSVTPDEVKKEIKNELLKRVWERNNKKYYKQPIFDCDIARKCFAPNDIYTMFYNESDENPSLRKYFGREYAFGMNQETAFNYEIFKDDKKMHTTIEKIKQCSRTQEHKSLVWKCEDPLKMEMRDLLIDRFVHTVEIMLGCMKHLLYIIAQLDKMPEYAVKYDPLVLAVALKRLQAIMLKIERVLVFGVLGGTSFFKDVYSNNEIRKYYI